MSGQSFFDEQGDQSIAKATIVAKYFGAWVTVMKGVIRGVQLRKPDIDPRIAYVDLFAGPGRYKSGAESTPIKILQAALKDEYLRQNLVTIFNDKDDTSVRSLQTAIQELPGIDTLKNQPDIWNEEVGDRIVAEFEGQALIPTLSFIDPWGYKGLSLKLINSVIKDWGSDSIIFFNYNRINAGLPNDFVKSHLDALFGSDRADALREKIAGQSPHQRELIITEEICQALKAMGGTYTLPFRFRNAQDTRTSHYLIFVSKSVRGYDIMKDIMSRESSTNDEGVPSFEYSPASRAQPLLFSLSQPLEALRGQLLREFAGRTMTFSEIFDAHNVDTPYVQKNYRSVLQELEKENVIGIEYSGDRKRKAFTYSPKTKLIFPQN